MRCFFSKTDLTYNNSSQKMPTEHYGINSNNKSDRLKVTENPLKWIFNKTTVNSFLQQQHNMNHSHSSDGSLLLKTMLNTHHGAKKADAPMLNLVYDSHLKQRYPDFR